MSAEAAGAGEPLIRIREVSRVLPGPVPATLVRDIDLDIGSGEFAAVVGPSGSGKSSLLYLLGLLDRPTTGTIRFDGAETTRLSPRALARLRLEKLGFVFQFHFLLEEFTALQNVMLPMRKLGRLTKREQEARAHGLLADLGLDVHAGRRPDQLSGGERQRVAIARALANDPRLILADEPTGNLDSVNAGRVFDIFARLADEAGKTVIVITHDEALAARTRRQIHTLDGRIVKGADAPAPV